jgi:hypothetical protein
MNTNLTAHNLATRGIPPNRANAKIVAPLSTQKHLRDTLSVLKLSSAADLPKSFDWRDHYNIGAVDNQANCGNCWAMSSTSVLTDRFLIQKELSNIKLDPLITTVCDTDESAGCGGGQPSSAGHFFETQGASEASSTCIAWDSACSRSNNCAIGLQGNPNLPSCGSLKCAMNFRAKKGSTHSLAIPGDANGTLAHIKADIKANGPVVGCFFVPEDFAYGTGMSDAKYRWNATNGIFINGAYVADEHLFMPPGSSPGQSADIINEGGGNAAHAVEIIGWGVGNAGKKYGNVPYWIIKNSWTSGWNDKGYWKHAMYPLNKKLGMDVPISTSYGLFGSATAFLPDTNTGPPHGGHGHSHGGHGGNGGNGGTTGPKSSKTKGWWLALWILLGVLALVLLIWFFKGKKKGKRK